MSMNFCNRVLTEGEIETVKSFISAEETPYPFRRSEPKLGLSLEPETRERVERIVGRQISVEDIAAMILTPEGHWIVIRDKDVLRVLAVMALKVWFQKPTGTVEDRMICLLWGHREEDMGTSDWKGHRPEWVCVCCGERKVLEM